MLQEIQEKKDSSFLNYVDQQKKAIVTYHLKNNSFYKKFAKNADLLDWNSIPIMTKKDLQQPLNRRLSNGFNLKNVYVNKTSGSTGNPFIFAKDKLCHAMTWAIIQDRFSWFDLDFNVSKQARFYGIPLHKTGYLKERLKDLLSKRYRFSVFDLSDNALEKCLHKFKNTPFVYINGYTSSIVQFAKFLENKNIILKQVCPTLKACIVTSEMLFKADKELMEKQFGIAVVNEYGASELDLIAFQNPDKQWQVNSETLFVEILDAQNNTLPYGKKGRVVITSLYNKAHPFIRYDIGDIGVLSKSSSLKKPVLKTLIGRTSDLIILPSGKKAAGLTFYYITKSIIEDDGKIKEFVIEQQKIDTFKIIYASSKTITTEKIKHILIEVENYLEKGLTVLFEKQEHLKRSKNGKLKQFTSLIHKQ
ncbi:MAG: phenylacetate--CoA ligase family protein [Oceanihabitans sp.]